MKTTADFWISLKEQSPEPDQVVLCYWPGCPDPGSEDHEIFKARYTHYGDKRTKGYFDTGEFEDVYWDAANQGVTHWMPLPTPPVKPKPVGSSLRKKVKASRPLSKFDKEFLY